MQTLPMAHRILILLATCRLNDRHSIDTKRKLILYQRACYFITGNLISKNKGRHSKNTVDDEV